MPLPGFLAVGITIGVLALIGNLFAPPPPPPRTGPPPPPANDAYERQLHLQYQREYEERQRLREQERQQQARADILRQQGLDRIRMGSARPAAAARSFSDVSIS